MKAHQAEFKVTTMCRVLSVSRSGYYAWLRRKPSKRQRANDRLTAEIRAIHKDSRGTYGAPRVHAELVLGQRRRVGHNRVARLMRLAGLRGVCRRRCARTTKRGEGRLPDLVDRQFTVEAPDRLWVADITYIPTWAGFLYLAVVVDAFSRRVVGWAMASHLLTELVLEAVGMALQKRRAYGVIHHSDQGSQYTSLEFGERCRRAGLVLSAGSVGDCYDNALCESFFATLECELQDRVVFRTRGQARRAIFEFIEGWYNPHRRHSSLGYLSPVEYEARYLEAGGNQEPERLHLEKRS